MIFWAVLVLAALALAGRLAWVAARASPAEGRRRPAPGVVRHDAGARPGPEWRKMNALYQSIVGEQFRRADHAAFAASATRSIEIVREPDNPHDSNALAVFGVFEDGGVEVRRLLGYLPRDFAAEVAATRPADMPILGVAVTTYTARSGYQNMKVDLYEPSVRSGYWRGLGVEAPRQVAAS